MNGIDNTIYKSPLRNLTKDNLLKLKNFMNLEEYLEHNFKNVKKNEHNLYVVSNNDKPIFSYIDITGYDLFNAINVWVNELIIKPNIDNYSFNQILNNYIIAYGEYNFLEEKKRELLLIFDKYLIPIYNTDYLYFNYNNDYILHPGYYETSWRPYNNGEYNKIIEILMYIIFDILALLYPTTWSYLQNDYLYNYIYKDIDDNLYFVNNNKLSRKNIIKTYLYQTWLFLINDDKLIDFFNTTNNLNSETIEYPSKYYNHRYWTSNRHNIVKFLNKYTIDKKYIINSEDFKKINILNTIKQKIFFNYNIYDNNNNDNKNIIIIVILSITLICIAIMTYIYIKYITLSNQYSYRIILGN